ncbi:unnamed protein product [Hymenolepis diminuta]|uniref:Uncharacterized protein n=1 Tax=Hymenolepis diminuta TaxID=6216 RepID=A0A564Y994_HYMDI|nr:unnamed protein product [Hymenolepis diminuta]
MIRCAAFNGFLKEISIVNNGCHILRAEDFRPLMFHKISKVPKLVKCNARFIIVVYEEIPEVIYICRREEPEQFRTLKFPKPILAVELTFTMIMVAAGDKIYIRKGKKFSEVFEYRFKFENCMPVFAEYSGKCSLAYVDPDNNSGILIWTVKKHNLLRIRMQSPIIAIALSPDTSFLVLAVESGCIRVYSYPFRQKQYQEFKPGLPEKVRICYMKIALNGVFLACACNDNKIYILRRDGNKFNEYAYVEWDEAGGKKAKRTRHGCAVFRNFLLVAINNGFVYKFDLRGTNSEKNNPRGQFKRKLKCSTALSCNDIKKYESDKIHSLPNPIQTAISAKASSIEVENVSDLNTKDDIPDYLFNLGEVSIFTEKNTNVEEGGRELGKKDISVDIKKNITINIVGVTTSARKKVPMGNKMKFVVERFNIILMIMSFKKY